MASAPSRLRLSIGDLDWIPPYSAVLLHATLRHFISVASSLKRDAVV